MAIERPPLSRDIRNLIRDGSVFRQKGSPLSPDTPTDQSRPETTHPEADNTARHDDSALTLAVDGFKQLISRDSPEKEHP